MSLYRKAKAKVFATAAPPPPPPPAPRQAAADQRRSTLEDGAAICVHGAPLQFKAAGLVITAGARPTHDVRGEKRQKKERRRGRKREKKIDEAPSDVSHSRLKAAQTIDS